AGCERLTHVARVVLHRKDEDLRLGRFLQEFRQHVDTALARENDVQQDHVRLHCTGAADRVFSRSGFTDDLEVLFSIVQAAQSGPHYGVVVDENDLDHSGMSIRMVVPAPGEVSTTIRPSCSSTRSRMPTSPKLPDPTAEGSKPMPSSSITA